MSNYVADFALCHWAKNKESEWLKIEMKNNGNDCCGMALNSSISSARCNLQLD